MSPAESPARGRGADWVASGLLFVAIVAGVSTLSALLVGDQWRLVGGTLAAIMIVSAAIVRSFARTRGWATLASVVAALFAMTAYFAADSALLRVIPTAATVDAAAALQRAGLASIANQSIPAIADQGIVFLVCIGIAAVTLAADMLIFVTRTPALAGFPLFVLLTVPTFVVPGFADLAALAFVAVAWLGIVLVCSRPVPVAAAATTVAIAVAVAIAAPTILPAVTPGGTAAGGVGGFAASVNPILTLGNDLRRPDAQPALTYTTTSAGGTYLRLAVLDDLTGQSWLPTPLNGDLGTDLGAIGPVPGVSADVAIVAETTTVSVSRVSSKWLPVPYAPTKITGLKGNWVWDRGSLVLSTDRSTLSDQVYEVTSAQVSPSVQQLESASPVIDPQLRRDLVLPPDLPAVVAETALAVVGTAATDYDKAISLQSFFSGGQFTYSEKAPVDAGYDGSGAGVLEAFLRAKSGYCVHFASAMTAMARTLGIPARVAVGFTPGQAVAGAGGSSVKYEVTTHDLHSWPELYFSGVGWVRFEPTPGRGIAPEFAPLVKDNPATPNIDESIPVPSSSRTPAPTPTARPSLPAESAAGPGSPTSPAREAIALGRLWLSAVAALIALVLAMPAVARTVRRRSNLREVEAGSAVRAWDEVGETAVDLGVRPRDALTPRQTASALGAELDAGAVGALERLRESLERESFAGVPGYPDVEDVRVVLRALRGSAGVIPRIVATVFPRSLMVRWRGVRSDATQSRA